MPPASLRTSFDRFSAQTQALQSLMSSFHSLSPAHQKLVAEIAHIRLCLALENAIEAICGKILCGAQYLDSTAPQLVAKPAGSTLVAFSLMKNHGRSKPLARLYWTKSKTIRLNMRTTLAQSDALFVCVSRHGSFLTELRQVRNHIAHGNNATAKEFRKAVKARYGALRRGMTPGLLLLSQAIAPKAKLEEYLIKSRVVIKDLVRA